MACSMDDYADGCTNLSLDPLIITGRGHHATDGLTHDGRCGVVGELVVDTGDDYVTFAAKVVRAQYALPGGVGQVCLSPVVQLRGYFNYYFQRRKDRSSFATIALRASIKHGERESARKLFELTVREEEAERSWSFEEIDFATAGDEPWLTATATASTARVEAELIIIVSVFGAAAAGLILIPHHDHVAAIAGLRFGFG